MQTPTGGPAVPVLLLETTPFLQCYEIGTLVLRHKDMMY